MSEARCGVLVALSLGAMVLCFGNTRTLAAEAVPAQVHAILADMAVLRGEFDPQPLHHLGLAGLRAVLDELLPETAQPPQLAVPRKDVLALIEQLGDPRFGLRREAEKKLLELGPGAAPLLAEATSSPDAELRWRAARLLRYWQAQRTKDKAAYVPAFAQYAAGIHDVERLDELARRVPLAFEGGLPPPGKQQILRECIKALARGGHQRHIQALRPLLKHAEVRVATLVLSAVGSIEEMDDSAVLDLLAEALRDERKEVAAAALAQISRRAPTLPNHRFLELVAPVFEQGPEPLKYQAALVLWVYLRHTPALEYFLAEIRSNDRSRRLRALAALSNTSGGRVAVDDRVLKTISPLLEESDFSTRRMAAVALAAFDGEPVVRTLIPLLGDRNRAIANEVARRLPNQSDKQMLRRALDETLAEAEGDLRRTAETVLQRLDDTQGPRR